MNTHTRDTIVRRFWSHVFNAPERVGVLVKNESPHRDEVLVVPPSAHGGVALVNLTEASHRQLTWAECGHIVAEIMLFLKSQGFKAGDRAAILSWNCPEWVWTDLAIQSLGGVSIPIYPNSAADQVNYILRDSGATIMFGDGNEQMSKVDATTGVKTVLFSEALRFAGDYSGRRATTFLPPDVHPKLSVRAEAVAEVKRIEAAFNTQPVADFLGVKQEDIATLIYTSGSTGVPKGVVILQSVISSACTAMDKKFRFTHEDRYLSYLPLAHVYERVDGALLCLWNGVTSAYCRVDEMADVVKQIKPTVMLGVPAVWRKIKDKAEAQLNAATGLKATLIRWAMKQKNPGFKRWVADLLVFSKIRAALGGKVRIMLSGGAPIAPEILDFFELVGFCLRQGYGLTETAGGVTVCTETENKVGSVGKPIDCVEIRIVPEPGQPEGTGVIWLKGDAITPGYWNMPEENAKTFTDGWFNTGDLGRIDADGYLWITGRKKRLLKTDGGKYVAPEKVEGAFGQVDELIACVVPVGDGKPFIGALIFVNQEKARLLANQPPGGVTPAEFHAKHPVVNKRVAEIVATANKSLERWETVKQFAIVPIEATVDNGLLTNKLSIRTEEVLKRYGHLVEELYTRPHKPE